ncbi:CoA-transferase [Nocardiopsis sp. RSe5-2]|uniref:CoA-transferase n=1 Tax=Nocardiopsis endophytica TaxID=3018445 RepID=A0ABT4U7H0_9ACTN|nr:CoA-transferase [Nocardiopsis endophytica]MDA2812881.1 CoA-transferase [Nocardiopsis endophytica]
MTAPPTRAEVAVAACADAWRGDGEVLAAAMAPCPALGARLARSTFAPDLLTTDGAAVLTREPVPLGADGEAEGWLPFRDHLWLVLHGRRHVMLGASQMDAEGRTNISCVGDWERPTAQLLGVRGCPGNTVRNTVSYWVPRHSRRVFTPKVDMVSGVAATDAHELRRVVTDLAVMDFGGPGRTLRLVSVHPGCTVEQVCDATGFDLALPEGGAAAVAGTRRPTGEELRLLRDVLDPGGVRDKEVPE